jgi:hypothetical protein
LQLARVSSELGPGWLAPERWFRRGAAVFTCAPARRPQQERRRRPRAQLLRRRERVRRASCGTTAGPQTRQSELESCTLSEGGASAIVDDPSPTRRPRRVLCRRIRRLLSVIAGQATQNIHIAFSGNDDDVRRFHPDTATAGYRSNGEPGERARYHVGYYTHSCSTPTATTSKSSTTTVGRECDPDGARDPQSRGPQKRHDPEAWTPEEVDEDAGRVGQCSVASRCLGISFLGSMNGISTTTAWRRSPATSTSSSVPSSASSIGTMA